MNNNKRSVPVLLIIIVAVSVLALSMAAIAWQRSNDHKQQEMSTASSDQQSSAPAKDTDKDSNKPVDSNGSLSGMAVYPSEGYPEDYRVCVVSVATGAEIVCDKSMAGKTGSQNFAVTVSPGTYQVVAKTDTMSGFYDKYMKDGHYTRGDVDVCDAQYHTPISLEVAPSQTITDLAVGNFYYLPDNCQAQ